MSLYALKREYEERRQALVDQLKNNARLDAETQHQLYGAIKEIENFLKTIEFQITNEQERQLNIDLGRDRPRPLGERTKGVVGKVRSGTRKVVKEHIPGVAKKVTRGPKKYLQKRKEKRRLKRELKKEFQLRMSRMDQRDSALPPLEDAPLGGGSGTVSSVHVSEHPSDGPPVRVGSQSDFAEEAPEPTKKPKKKPKS